MSSRIVVLVAAGIAALSVLAVATAAPVGGTGLEPQLNVSAPAAAPGYAINAQIKNATTTETGRISLFAPAHFKASFPAVGAEAGSASVRLQLADRNDTYVNLKGKVVAAAAEKLSCVAHATTAAASFLLNVSGGGLTLSIPMAAYRITGARTKYSSYELTQCLPPPGVPKGTPGRAPGGRPFRQRDADAPGTRRPEERHQLLELGVDAVHHGHSNSRRCRQRRGAGGHRRTTLRPARRRRPSRRRSRTGRR